MVLAQGIRCAKLHLAENVVERHFDRSESADRVNLHCAADIVIHDALPRPFIGGGADLIMQEDERKSSHAAASLPQG